MGNKFIKTDFGTIKYKDTPDMHKKVFDYIMNEYFILNNAFSGETICQCDEPQINAPNVLGEIADFLFEKID